MADSGRWAADLIAVLDAFVADDIDLGQLNAQFYFPFHDAPEGELTAGEEDFFSAASEKLDFTGDNVAEADRQDGWIDPSEARGWLRGELLRFRAES